MTRWAHENDYDVIVRAASASFGGRVPVPVIKAVIATESSFNPAAIPPSNQADYSVGLMQVTLKTAQSTEIGFPGTVQQLAQVGTNVYIGTKILDYLHRKYGDDWDAVYSAYNGGERPAYGFGKRVTKPTTVCLARDKSGKCLRSYTAKPGEFGNQPNVTRFRSALDYFFGDSPPRPEAARHQSGGATG